jgi:hypothetical protein
MDITESTLGPRFKDPKLVLKAWGFLIFIIYKLSIFLNKKNFQLNLAKGG